MIRRSLFVFLAAVVLGLALTVVFALFGLPGPAGMIADAEQRLQQGKAAEAVRILDGAEKSPALQDNPQLRRRMLSARLRAHQQLDIPQRAIRDLDELLALLPKPDEQLALDRINLLGRLGKGEEALADARQFVETHPDHPRGLELAGEAAHAAYRESLRQTAAAVVRDLAGADASAGSEARLHYLYLPEGDPAQAAGLQQLRELYRKRANRQQAWPMLEPELRALRPRIQEGLDWSRRSLENGGKPVDAWRSLSFALQQADRLDDVTALGEIYLLRFDHVYAAEAAAAVAGAHVESGMYTAVLELGRRFLPPGTLGPRLKQKRLDDRVQDLLQAEVTAAWRLRDKGALNAIGADLQALLAAGGHADLALFRQAALMAMLNGDRRVAEDFLKTVGIVLFRDKPAGMDEYLAEWAALRLQVLRERGAKENEQLEVIDAWAKAVLRSDSVEPLIARTRLQLEFHQASAALGNTEEIQRLRPQDEALLHLQAEAADANYRDSNQDGEGLVQQCLNRHILVPDVPRPVCYLLAAEAALKASLPRVARECARRARDKFSWSRWPGLLEARAVQLGGDAAGAATLLAQLLEQFPGDPEALQLLLRVRAELGQPLGPLLYDVVASCPQDPYTAELLLRTAVDAGDMAATKALVAGTESLPAPRPALLALQARALAMTGHVAEAGAAWRRAAAGAGAEPPAALQADLLAAALAELSARAPAEPDAILERDAREYVHRCRAGGAGAQALLLRTANTMAAQERPRTASSLATAALDLADGEQLRNGAAFALAGHLAVRTGELALAADLLTAAVSFPDGTAAAEELSRVCLLAGRQEKAAQAWHLAEEPADPALALALGEDQTAASLAHKALDQDATALVPACVSALLADPAASLGADLQPIGGDARSLLLKVLVRLQDPALAAAAVPACEELVALHPDAMALRLLLARAQLEAGQPALAVTVHGALAAAGNRHPCLLAEAVRAAARPGYLMPPAIARAIDELAFTPGSAPTIVRVHAIRQAAMQAQLLGQPEVAAQMLSELWLREPEFSGLRVADALFLLGRKDQQRTGLQLLDRLRARARGTELTACLEGLFGIGDALAEEGDRPMADALRVAALDTIQQHGPRAAAVWFLLRDDARRVRDHAASALEPEQQRTLLDGALALCAAGVEAPRWAERCLDLLAAQKGDEAAVLATEALLRQRPSLLPVWLHRAALLVGLQRPTAALAGLRHLLAYADDPLLMLGTVSLAARSRALQPEDITALAALPAAVQDSAAGRFTAGLVALRGGEGERAEQLLALVPPQADGSHLYFRALANLVRRAPGAREQARALFQQLATDYPSSSLARYAGSFARQLAHSP